MFIYSSLVAQFIRDIQSAIQEILTQEIRLRCRGSRFYARDERSSYPIHVVIYNDKAMLGYFDSEFYELGFHQRLIHSDRKILKNIIRHELAHYMVFINSGPAVQSHGPEFHRFCEKMGWGRDISDATIELGSSHDAVDLEGGDVLRKVRKLMALSTSHHAHEAEQAMVKAQQLLLKHNMEAPRGRVEEEDPICMRRVLRQKKVSAKMRAIGSILQTFFVGIVYRKTEQFTHLEVFGNQTNLEIASYVASFLETEFEKLWDVAQKGAGCRGIVAKNSFFLGIAKGYCKKIEALKKDYPQETRGALIVLEKELIEAQGLIYGRLSSSRSQSRLCAASSALGEKMGRQLSINPAVSGKSGASGRQITLQQAE